MLDQSLSLYWNELLIGHVTDATTRIPVCLWFLARNKKNGKFRDRRGETLFIDARKLGALVDRTHCELSGDEIARIAKTYHAWRGEKDAGKYDERMEQLRAKLKGQFAELAKLEKALLKNLASLGFTGKELS